MNKYPVDPKLQFALVELYHNFIENATETIKKADIDFSKIEIEVGEAYDCNDVKLTKCHSTCLYYENFLLATVSVGFSRA